MKKILSTELYILIFLHNYFIMHDIKYFFLNKNNQTIQRAKKILREDKLPKVSPKNIVFSNTMDSPPFQIIPKKK
jgi:hypothetical protein